MFDLDNSLVCFVKTIGGRSVFIIADETDNIEEAAVAAATVLEQIAPDPGSRADPRARGIVSIQLYSDAIEEIEKALAGLKSGPSDPPHHAN